MKTLFTIMLCVTTLVLGISYPFTPKQLLLLEMFIIGVPSFILTFQPNNELIRGNFIPQVLKKSIPCSLIMFINVLIILILNDHTATLSENEFTSLCTMLLTFVGFINLTWICWPLNWLRTACVTASATLIIASLAGLSKFFSITDFTFPVMTTLVTLLLCTIIVIIGIYYLKEWYLGKKTIQLSDGTVIKQSFWKIMKSTFKKKKESQIVVEETTPEIQKEPIKTKSKTSVNNQKLDLKTKNKQIVENKVTKSNSTKPKMKKNEKIN